MPKLQCLIVQPDTSCDEGRLIQFIPNSRNMRQIFKDLLEENDCYFDKFLWVDIEDRDNVVSELPLIPENYECYGYGDGYKNNLMFTSYLFDAHQFNVAHIKRCRAKRGVIC